MRCFKDTLHWEKRFFSAALHTALLCDFNVMDGKALNIFWNHFNWPRVALSVQLIVLHQWCVYIINTSLIYKLYKPMGHFPFDDLVYSSGKARFGGYFRNQVTLKWSYQSSTKCLCWLCLLTNCITSSFLWTSFVTDQFLHFLYRYIILCKLQY